MQTFKLRNLLLSLVIVVLVGGVFPKISQAEEEVPPLTAEEEQQLSQQYENLDSVISAVEPFVKVTSTGRFILDPFAPTWYKERYAWDALQEHFNELNQQADAGTITITANKEIIENIQMYGVTKTKKHWWGYTRYLNNTDTKNAIAKLNSFGSVVSLAVFFKALNLPTVGFVTSFAGGYHKIIANRLQANNKGNGTILSVTWVMAFNVKPQ